MPPGGVHLLAGVGVLRLTHGAVDALAWKRFPLVNTKDRLKALVNGFILGCIAPDADLLLCVLIGSFTNIQEKDLENVHRTFSHSLVVLPIGKSSFLSQSTSLLDFNFFSPSSSFCSCKCCHWSSQQVRGTPRHRT